MNEPTGEGYPASGCPVKRPLKIRILQYASLVLALAGLGLLCLFSINRDIPVVKVGDIMPTMNFATVRIIGEVTRDAYIFKSGGLAFNVKDSTGEISVMGGRSQAEALTASGKLPRRGDQVEAAGSLSVSADQEVKLRLQSAGQLVLHRKKNLIQHSVTRTSISDISAGQKGRQIEVTGTLKSITVPGPGSKAPYMLTLEDDGAELAVIFWNDVFQSLEGKLPVPGKLISASGQVDVYKNAIQLEVRDAADLRVVESRL